MRTYEVPMIGQQEIGYYLLQYQNSLISRGAWHLLERNSMERKTINQQEQKGR